jgi:hypothetical protein
MTERVLKSRNFTREYVDNGVEMKIDINARIYSLGDQEPRFSLTANYWEKGRRRDSGGGGCCHGEIIKVVPTLEKYVKWHLFSPTTGPMHYVANAMHFASDRDCWGKTKGEPYRFEKHLLFNGVPIPYKIDQHFLEWVQKQSKGSLEIEVVPYTDRDGHVFTPKATFKGYTPALRWSHAWYGCPFNTVSEAEEFLNAWMKCAVDIVSVPTAFGEGKESELDKARSAAIWPEAELSDFTKEKLEARLPGLIEEFNRDMAELFE